MGYEVKTSQPCIDCNEPTTHRRSKSRAPVCYECGIRRACAEIIANAKRAERQIKREKALLRRRDRIAQG